MKNLYKLSLVSAFLLLFAACEEDEALEIENVQDPFQIENGDLADLTLNFSYPDNPAFTLSWEDEITGSETQTVVMGTDAEISNPVTLGTSSTDQFTISVSELNQTLLDNGAQAFKPFSFFVDVRNDNANTDAVNYTAITYVTADPSLSAPTEGSDITLDGSASDDTAATLTFNDFDTTDAIVDVNYVLQASADGTNFQSSQIAGTSNSANEDFDSTIEITNASLNEIALLNGVGSEESGSLEFRIVSSITTETGTLERASNSVSVSVTTFSTEKRQLFLVGNATAPGWENNNNNPALIRDPNNDNLYTYRARFLGGDMAFKLLEMTGQWQPQWGTNDGVTVAVNDGTGSDPDVFSVPTDGYYEFQIDLANLTFEITPYDVSGATEYPTVAIIGSGTPNGWDAPDTDMTQSTFDPHIWQISNVNIVDGEMKFRANDAWDVNWGSDTAISGFGSMGGPNIPVSAGTYDIWFNDLDGGYILIPVE